MDKPHDYPVAFGDKQRLQRFRQKLIRIRNVLDATRAVMKSLKSRYQQFQGSTFTQLHEPEIIQLDDFLGHCKRVRRGIETLLQVANGIDELVSPRLFIPYPQELIVQLSKILEFRNDRVLLQTSQAMQNSLGTLNEISAQNAEVAEQGRLDSRTLKMLTVIATIYLPASLIGVSCTSDSDSASLATYFFFVADSVQLQSNSKCPKRGASGTGISLSISFSVLDLYSCNCSVDRDDIATCFDDTEEV